MPRPAAGVPGKGMSRRRHRTAERQPGAGNSHIGPYVRRDAEASQVTVPAPLLRQGFLREDSGPLERMPESGRPGARSQSISRPAGLQRVGQTASTIVGAVVFLSGCGLSCRPGRRRGGGKGRQRNHTGPPQRGIRTGRAQAGRGKQREEAVDTRRVGGCGLSRRPESGRLSGRQAGETGKGPKRGWEPGRIGKIRPAGQMLRPIRQPCARKGEKQPAGRRMRFSLYRFVL